MKGQGFKFSCKGVITKVEVRTGKKSGNPYGQIRVATGESAAQFFADVDDINSGLYGEGQEIHVEGDLVMQGYELRTTNERILSHEGKQQRQPSTDTKAA